MVIVENIPGLLRYFVLVNLQKIKKKQYALSFIILFNDYLYNALKNAVKQFIRFLILFPDEIWIKDSLLVKYRKGR